SIGFTFIKEHHLIRFHDCLDLTCMMHVDAAVRKHEMCCANAFLGAFVLACARAQNVPHRHGVSRQKWVRVDFSHCSTFALAAPRSIALVADRRLFGGYSESRIARRATSARCYERKLKRCRWFNPPHTR